MNHNIQAGDVYLHRKDNIKYQVDKIIFDATNYEISHTLVEKVLYTQLEDGKKCPKGTQYTRDISNFMENFSHIP